jgi:hypothetical protein
MYTKESTERPSDIAMREKKEKKKPKPSLAKVFQKKNKSKIRKKNKRTY